MTARTAIRRKKGPSAVDRFLDILFAARRQARVASEKAERLESFLRAAPVDYCGWGLDGALAVSPGFSSLFGVYKIETPAQIRDALTPPDAELFAAFFSKLEEGGLPFEATVQTTQGRALRLMGKKAEGADGAGFHAVWAVDVTGYAQAAAQNAEALSRVERKESDLRGALNTLPFPVWMRGRALDIAWCNKAYARTVDDSAASVIADQKELSLSALDGVESVTPRVLAQRALAAGATQSLRGHVVVEGDRRLYEATETPVPGQGGTVGAATDVTREEELIASYKRLSSSQMDVLERLPTAIAMFSADTRLDFYNTAYEQMTGMSGAWLDTRPKLVDMIDKLRELRKIPEQADYRQYKQAWLSRFTALIEAEEEMQYLPDSSVQRMIVMPRPAGGLVVTIEDVTSRLQLETSYNTLMAVQRETIDSLSEGIAVFGEDGKLRLSNQSFGAIWGARDVPPSSHVTRVIEGMKGFFAPAAWDETRKLLLSNALEREPRKGRLTRVDGSVLEYSVVPLPDGNILNAWFDVTDTVKVEQALVEKNVALEAAERLKTDFLANVSYQLRTPLNAIMGFAEILNQQYFGKLNERQMEYTVSMIEAGQRLISLINDILDLSTIEAGYMKLYPARVRLSDVVAQVVDLTAEWARKQRIEISIEGETSGLAVHADERRVKQVLLNLISNAINYSPGGGRIVITARAEGGYALVQVKDSGIGIPQEELDRVFTIFERIRSKTMQRRSGAGLGLALVKSIVELHGGDVRLESREGEGTTVTFRLPLDAAPAAQKTTAIS